MTWNSNKGLFSSFIHLNFQGKSFQTTVRNKLSFPDGIYCLFIVDNGFVTINVLEMLLRVREFGVEFPNDVYTNALAAIMDHLDKNSPSQIPKFNFWRQVGNESIGYRAYPANIAVPLDDFGKAELFFEFIIKKFFIKGNTKEDLQKVLDFGSIFSKLSVFFAIPPDADDTGCALGVTSQMLKIILNGEDLGNSTSLYFSSISDPNAESLNDFLKYAYRPLSHVVDESVIDPRTYRWMRPFLQKTFGKVAIITTWFQHISEIVDQGDFQKMPFLVNNVDGSVVVNALYGILSTVIAQPYKYGRVLTPTYIRMMMNNFDLIEYILKHDLLAIHAPSILLYYPSRYAFYYFVTRLMRLMDSASDLKRTLPDVFNMLKQKLDSLKAVMRKYGTDQILQLVKSDATGMSYWDDFLGNGDFIPKYEDRVFSSAMAFNALINTWTEKSVVNDTVSLKYVEYVPTDVVTLIERTARFLLSRDSDDLPQENAFFSASVKSGSVLPFYSVTNYRTSPDGTRTLECDGDLFKGFNVVFGVKGIMNEQEYLAREKAGCFNTTTKSPDVDYNSPDSVFPYWSAPSYTYSTRLLALVNYKALL